MLSCKHPVYFLALLDISLEHSSAAFICPSYQHTGVRMCLYACHARNSQVTKPLSIATFVMADTVGYTVKTMDPRLHKGAGIW